VSPLALRLHPPDARLLTGRRALVTGATSGIGREIALELARHGAAVAINHREAGSRPEAEGMAGAVEAAGGRAVPVAMDVAREDEVARAFAEAAGALGGLDLVVSITSVHDRMPWERFSHYAASKAGMRLFIESIAKELAPHGIRVVAVAPGAIATPINRETLDEPEELAQTERQIPLGRIGEPAEVARAVAWLASDQASYVTGATLLVDGGLTLYPPGSG
jgi:glucose 1-dehydrogenase